MSVRDLIVGWEEALAVALSQPGGEAPVTELYDDDLTSVPDLQIARIRSNVRAGQIVSFADDCATVTEYTPLCL